LWPYRRSATKNQQRWTFGGVYPHGWSDDHPDDASVMQTQCLLEAGAEARLNVHVRFLQIVRRQAAQNVAGKVEFVDELTVDGERHLTWDEARERDVQHRGPPRAGVSLRIAIVEGAYGEPVGRTGVLLREWETLDGTVAIAAKEIEAGLVQLSVRVENTTPWQGGTRDDALRRAFISTHTVLRVEGGAFVSLTDPPPERSEAAAECENVGTWPVLVGEPGDRTTLLSSPIILPDYPEIAPESPGDLFDGTEIDELLTLSILGLSDEEKREMQASDPRAREILRRSSTLTPEQMLRLHGKLRTVPPP
jgi:hydrogenase maturation protease